MIKLATAALALCIAAALSGGDAVATIRYVATTGNDANACTRTAPCRFLQRAHDIAAAGDEIQILNSGDFGTALNIYKPTTISAIGVSATITNGGSDTVAIQISDAAAHVVLRGLILRGSGAADSHGIQMSVAGVVRVDRCTFERFSANGILTNADDSDLYVTDSVFRDNQIGIAAFNATGATVTIDNSLFESNEFGVSLSDFESAILRTVISHGETAIAQDGGTLSSLQTTMVESQRGYQGTNGATATFESCVARGNEEAGMQASGGSTLRISNCHVTGNFVGVQNVTGSTILTRQNNTVSGNTDDVDGTLTPLAGL